MNETNNPNTASRNQRPIESASASTLPQTNPSRFAYVLTASVLGLITLLVLAITLLLYTAFSTYYLSTDAPSYLYQQDDGDSWSRHNEYDEFDFEDEHRFMDDAATLL